MLYIIWGKGVSVLIIRDDELNVRHNNNTSLKVAEGGHVGDRKLMWLIGEANSRLPAFLGTVGTKTCHNNIFVFIFTFYS